MRMICFSRTQEPGAILLLGPMAMVVKSTVKLIYFNINLVETINKMANNLAKWKVSEDFFKELCALAAL